MAPTATAEAPIAEEPIYRYASQTEDMAPSRTVVRQNDYRAMARTIASQKGVQPATMLRVIDCENPDWNPALQSQIPAHGPNGKEDSWGLAQIHLPSHPSISRAEATDPVFALNWMADEFAAGRARQWSCYK